MTNSQNFAETVRIVSFGRIRGGKKDQYWAFLSMPCTEPWRKDFSSEEEYNKFMIDNFWRLDKKYISKYDFDPSCNKNSTGLDLTCTSSILDLVFGQRDWTEGIEDRGYDTRNCGYINSYSGSKLYPEYGIEIFGTSSYGDAHYGYDGSIRWRFIL